MTISKSAVKNATIGIPTAKTGDAGIGGYVGIKTSGDLKITDCEVTMLLCQQKISPRAQVQAV